MQPHYKEHIKDFDELDVIGFDLLFDPNKFRVISRSKKKITKNFTQREFFSKCKNAGKHYLHSDLIVVAQKLRDYYNSPIKITSSYRSHSCNLKAKGASRSKHLTGRALDLKFVDQTTQERFINDLKNKRGGYYLLIYNNVTGIGVYDSHVHLDVRKGKLAFWDYTGMMLDTDECLN